MRLFLILLCATVLTACSAKPGSQSWCAAKSEQAKSEWTGEDTMTYAKHCVFDSQTIGSEAWCEDLQDTPKGDWTATEAGDYAKHCVI